MQNPPLAIVTGASSGIGRAIAVRLARGGFRTVLIARRTLLLMELASELQPHARSIVLPLDLNETDRIAPAVSKLLAVEGPASVLINGAGFGAYGLFEDLATESLGRLMRVNFEAAATMVRATLPGLKELGQAGSLAHVVNICSMSARVGTWGHSGYGASKAAMRSLSETLASELEEDGVCVSSSCSDEELDVGGRWTANELVGTVQHRFRARLRMPSTKWMRRRRRRQRGRG